MGMNDNGLLEQEWDGATEVNLGIVLERYSRYYDDFILEVFLPFSFHYILAEKAAQNFSWTKPMELIETLLKPYRLQKAWFSDDVRLCGVTSEYIISVDLYWALIIMVSSDNHDVLQNMKNSLTHLFSDLVHWKNPKYSCSNCVKN